MPETRVKIEMDLTDENIGSDATPTTENNSNFADISKLNEPHSPYNPFMTLEHNISVLDGSLDTFDEPLLNLSYFSNSLSSDDCETSDKITINFSQTHSIAGITFDFGADNFLEKVTLSYFYGDKLLNSNDFYPNKQNFTEKYAGDNFNKITIEFNNTRFPRMFTRLQSISFGFVYTWGSGNILDCQIMEEVNPISGKVPINTCSVTIYDENNQFNILNFQGVYKYLQEKQKFKVYAFVNNTETPMGVHYLDTWYGNKPYEITFNLISILGILDKATYYGGGIIGYNEVNPTAYDLMVNILNDAGLTIDEDFTVSEDLKDTKVLGLLPICSHKEAIQNAAFTANSCVDDTKDGKIKIYRQNQDIRFTLDQNVLFDPVNVTKNEVVTGIDIVLHYYDFPSSGNDYKDVFNGELNASEIKRIMSGEPIFSVRYKKDNSGDFIYLTPGEDFTVGKYYFDFTPSVSGVYLFQILQFKESTSIYSKKSSKTLPGRKENILKVEKATLLFGSGYYFGAFNNSGNIEKFADNLMNFYEYNTLKIDFEYLSDGSIKTGQKGSIFTDFNQYLIGSILSQRINLSEGLITKCEMIANNKNLTNFYFATTGVDASGNIGQYELYDSDNFLI
jgi:hypothetical protein